MDLPTKVLGKMESLLSSNKGSFREGCLEGESNEAIMTRGWEAVKSIKNEE